MAFLRQWLVLGCMLVLGGGSIFATGTREDRDYAAALAAFRDGFYDRAAAGLTQFLQTHRKSPNTPEAVLRLAQAEFYLGKYTNAAARLTDPGNRLKARTAGLADQYVFWTGEAQFGSGDFTNAAATFISVPEQFSNSPLGLNAVVAAAAALAKLPDWPRVDRLLNNPDGVFQRAAQLDPAGETVANGRLLQAESKCAQRDFAAALDLLKQLKPALLTPEQDWKRAHELYRAELGLDDLDAALAATTSLLQLARHGQGGMGATNLAESVASRAGVLEKMGRRVEAIAAWQENLTNGAPAEFQQRAILKTAELTAAQNNLAEAEAGLETFLRQFPNSPAAEHARLALGELQLKDFIAQPAASNYLALAREQFDQLLASANGSLAGKAYLDRGWCGWLAEKYPESLADFQAAAQQLPPSEDQAVARFKMGDAQFAQKDFAGCQTNYQAVLTDYAPLTTVASSLGDRALYQILRARLELQDTNGLDEAMRQLLEKFAASAVADSGRLLAGEGFSDFGSPVKAREVFRKFEAERADSPLRPRVALAAARTFEREQNWPAAVTHYQDWLAAYPTNELRPQVEYTRAWAVAQAGDESRAFDLFNHFVSSSTNAFTPLALWWVADHFFRLGDTNFQDAEKNYELVFQKFPTSELAYPAQWMAGRAAMGRFSYAEAIRAYFNPLVTDTNCPDDLRVKAKFAYCDALWQMAASDTNNANLQLATNILAQITPMAATNAAGALAWSEIGDCDRQLGAFDAATNAYAQVLNSPAADTALRHRAQVGLGLVLEKKAEGMPDDGTRNTLLNEALNHYLDVVYSRDDEFWIKKAGLQALPLISLVSDRDSQQLNRFFDELEALLPQLKAALEKKRAALKN